AEVLGPVELVPSATGEPRERALVRAPTADARELADALATAQATRTARKASDPVRVRLDPQEIA
ncbi:MAG: primosome assembly protein PriA, partial [Actinomycetota bacterium]|nr:primosome assembly protein PriA [Actinomycetota bacterium]